VQSRVTVMIHVRWPEMTMRSREFLPREGTSDRESSGRVTALGVETISAVLTVAKSALNKHGTRRVKTATEVSEVDRHNEIRNSGSVNRDQYSPRIQAIRQSDSGVVKTLDFLGPERRNLSGVRRAQVLTMIREQPSTGTRK